MKNQKHKSLDNRRKNGRLSMRKPCFVAEFSANAKTNTTAKVYVAARFENHQNLVVVGGGKTAANSFKGWNMVRSRFNFQI